MKFRITAFLIAISAMLAFAGCNKKTISTEKYEVAFITDVGTVEDGGCNEQCYNGIEKYCTENGISYTSYIPEGYETQVYMQTITKAVENGANVIVCPGYLLEEAVYNSASEYEKVSFILVDGIPHNSDYTDYTIPENVLSITFAEEEAGFLAGYAAVRDGYDRLGFLGSMPEESVIKYGYGFVQGADYAGIEIGKKVYIAYTYMGTFSDDQKVYDTAAVFYDYSVEAIMASGGTISSAVMQAAEEKGKAVIGVDVDESIESPSVVFSCIKNYEDAVYNAVADVYNESFPGGTVRHLTASEKGIEITMDKTFNEFSEVEYSAIYNELASKEIVPYAGTDIGTTAELDLVNTEIIYQ